MVSAAVVDGPAHVATVQQAATNVTLRHELLATALHADQPRRPGSDPAAWRVRTPTLDARVDPIHDVEGKVVVRAPKHGGRVCAQRRDVGNWQGRRRRRRAARDYEENRQTEQDAAPTLACIALHATTVMACPAQPLPAQGT